MTSRVSGGLGRYFGFLTMRIPLPHDIVRAGVVKHPLQWAHDECREIQEPLKAVRDHRSSGIKHVVRLCTYPTISALRHAIAERDARWSEPSRSAAGGQSADRPRLGRR